MAIVSHSTSKSIAIRHIYKGSRIKRLVCLCLIFLHDEPLIFYQVISKFMIQETKPPHVKSILYRSQVFVRSKPNMQHNFEHNRLLEASSMLLYYVGFSPWMKSFNKIISIYNLFKIIISQFGGMLIATLDITIFIKLFNIASNHANSVQNQVQLYYES